LQQRYGDRGFNVVGFPCNQFGDQEPGSAEEIQTFCSTTYGVTFPMMEKIEVNGPNRHPIYAELTGVADAEGHSGDIRWNFEKFLLGTDGSVTRFSPTVEPDDPALVTAIEAELS
jgi:glutathione peroxidase